LRIMFWKAGGFEPGFRGRICCRDRAYQSKCSYRGREMHRLFNSVKTFLVSEDGPTSVEYAVLLALIIIVCVTAIKSLGTTVSDRFTDAKNGLTPAP
jgi:pilus assembly protein Flp/PilA